MPCRNPDCERNCLTDAEQLQATIEFLRRVRVERDLAEALGSDAGCMMCSCRKVATWLEELLDKKEEERGHVC